ncbi:MAG TPA: copper transporter, partial [Streptosporangiaceae bacterium]|nr:copper transporter [Streptosporangiaceae bacterium]
MIDFRYHLVSIVAVFLALAIGLVIGSTALRGTVLTGLNKASAHEQKVNTSLYLHNAQLKQQIGADDAFARAAEVGLLRGLLDGEHVVLVLAPGADSSTVDGITAALQQAG